MTSRNRLAVLTGCLALALAPLVGSSATAGTPAAAPGQAPGTITGRVRNAATDQYLNNARVTLKGTNQTVYTDNFGVFQLINVPPGPAVLEVFYTDLDVAQVTVDVPSGGTVERAVDLTSVKRYGSGDTVQLDAFVVASDKETDAQAIAINEQRFAPNIMNVMSTDSLGDVLGSSVGEFLKFMPGITAEFDNADIAGISVRGIGGGMTSVTADGAPSSNIWVGATRSVDVRSMALNDISRIELTKVPTPATPADSLAGSVNMVSKSAFERSGRQLRYGLNFVANHENLKLKPTPHSHLDRKDYKVLPGVNFDFTWPVTKTFGLVIAGTSANIYNEQHFSRTTWATAGTGSLASASRSNPFLRSYLLLDGPRNITRNTLSVKADWKTTRHSVLSVGHMINRATTRIGTLQITFDAGTNGTPTPANSSEAASFDPTFTRGAMGRGAISNNGTNQLINQKTDSTNLKYRYDDGRWKVETGLSRSESRTKRRYHDAGFFYQALATNNRPVRINFLDISGDKPGTMEILDAANQPFEWRDLANFRPSTANNADLNNKGQYNTGYLNVRRRFDLFPFPTALQAGATRRHQTLDTSAQSINWTYMGPGGAGTAGTTAEPYAMQVYKDVDSHYGFYGIEWMSPMRAFRAWQLDPLLYQKTEAQMVAEGNYRVDNSEFIKETVNAYYLQAEAEFFRNRLRVLGGVRFEETHDRGQGGLTDADAVWQRNPDGSFVRNAAGQRVRKPEAGAVNSYQQFLLTRTRRGAFSNREYDGYYPSLHLTYSATENFLTRAAWAKTYGRPNFTDIIPRTVVTGADLDEDDDPDPLVGRGTLTIRNPSLTPWTADNYDLSFEYYTPQGGLFSAGVFLKEIKNFFGDGSRMATPELLNELGLDARYLDWNIRTKFNAGDARITGAEFNVKHSLRELGRWAAPFTVFANATKLDLDGNQGASFTSFIPKSGNWGATFSYKRLVVTARWNYRGLDRRLPQAAFGPEGYEYYKARITLDMNASYQLTKRLSLAASGNNLTNEPQTLLRYGPETPAYARQYQEAEYGIQLAVGLRGTF